MLKVDVSFDCPLWHKDVKLVVSKTLKEASKFLKREGDSEVSVVLTSDKEIAKLNHYYRGMNKPTNVLSFESRDPDMLGDIVIAYQTLVHEAITENISFEAHFRHLLVHGFLHLLGYNHLTDAQAEQMEALEVEILAAQGIASPYEE